MLFLNLAQRNPWQHPWHENTKICEVSTPTSEVSTAIAKVGFFPKKNTWKNSSSKHLSLRRGSCNVRVNVAHRFGPSAIQQKNVIDKTSQIATSPWLGKKFRGPRFSS